MKNCQTLYPEFRNIPRKREKSKEPLSGWEFVSLKIRWMGVNFLGNSSSAFRLGIQEEDGNGNRWLVGWSVSSGSDLVVLSGMLTCALNPAA